MLIVCLCLVGLLGLPAGAYGYSFGPHVTGLGPEEMVFDWATERCEEWDVPDHPARAFRDNLGRVQLHFAHHEPRRNIAGDLNTASSLGNHDCTVTSWSQRDPDPSHYDNFTWISAPYTIDGQTVYSLAHQEYRGWNYGCTPPQGGDSTACWYNSITLSTSTNRGDLFTHTAQPTHLVNSMPDVWVPATGPYGFFQPSNIIKKQPDDGYFYAMVRAKEPGGPDQTCLMRTNNLASPTSWRAWDGAAFTVRSINPYLETPANRADHVCSGITALSYLNGSAESLTYNTYYGKFMLVGVTGDYGSAGAGFYFALSDDLINWTEPELLIGRETAPSWQCGDPDPVRDVSLLDPTSGSQNFETTGQQPYVYYKIFNNNGGCGMGPDRDKLRVPIQLSGTVPVASFTATPSPALIENTTTFNASASSDPGGNPITAYDWDLDGDGYYETPNGANPIMTKTFASPESGTIGLRVTDSQGLQDIVRSRVDIDAKVNMQPDWALWPATYAEDSALPWSDARGFGWVRQDSLSGTRVPLDLTANTRDRDRADTDPYEQKLDTLVFMQYPQAGHNRTARRTPGAWEMALPCGVYNVTVGVGDSRYRSSSTDPGDKSTHRINVEGLPAIAGFQPTDANKFQSATTTVPVCDGRLTIDATGGSNTKLNFVDVNRANPSVNFQPSFVSPPGSYARDLGGSWSASRGYGWVRQDSLSSTTHVPLDLGANVRDRDLSDTDGFDQNQDTIVFMQYPQAGTDRSLSRTRGAWEMEVPCGAYTVTVGVGDSAYRSASSDPGNKSTHRINVEGQTAISGFQPTDATKFASATLTAVPVCDGRLTIDAVGGTNTKLSYVNVVPVSIIG